MTVTTKVCRKCGARFAKRSCPECDRRRAAAWYAAHPEQAKASAKARRAADPEKGRRYAKKWAEANRERKRALDAAWREANPERARATRRSRELRKRYGLTPEQYATMLAAQGGMCAICRATPGPGQSLCVDHDHATGDVRELLCSRCNRQVGIHENSNAAAVRAYLRKHGGDV